MQTQEKTLKDILAQVLTIDTSEFTTDTALLGAIPELDSMAIMSLLLELEQSFSLSIDAGDISAEHFETLGALQSFIEQQQCLQA